MKKAVLIFSIVFFLCKGVVAQEKIYMPYFEVINMHPDYQNSATHLLKTYLESGNKMELILPDKDTLYYKEGLFIWK